MEQQLDRNPTTPDALQYDSASDERDIKDEHDEDNQDMNPTPNLCEIVEKKEISFEENVINNINRENGVNDDGSENGEIICRLSFVNINLIY